MEGTTRTALRRRVRRAITAAIASVALLGAGMQGAVADDPPPIIDVGGTPIDQLQAQLQALETQLDTNLAKLNPYYASLHSEIDGALAYLTPYLGTAGIPPATLQALVLAAQVEAGPLFANTCPYLVYLENNLPDSVLGVPLSVAKLIGLTPTQMQKITAYLNGVINTQVQALQAAVTPSMLQLLAMSWNTTAYSTSPATVRSTAGYVGIPSLLDIDGAPGADLCSDFSVNATTGKITEVITKLPLSAPTLPVDVLGALPSLGNISIGYSTKTSTAPNSWTSVIGGASGGGSLGITNTTTKPGANLTEVLALGSAGAITYAWAPVPATAITGLGGSGTGVAVPTQVSSASKFDFQIGLGASLSLGMSVDKVTVGATPSVAALGFGTTGGLALQSSYTNGAATSSSFSASVAVPGLPMAVNVTPLPKSFKTCTSIAGIGCSDVTTARPGTTLPANTLSYSTDLESTSLTTATTAINATSCATATLGAYTQVTGTFANVHESLPTNTTATGHLWADTNGHAASGCTGGLGLTSTLPAGTTAGGTSPAGRLGTFTLLALAGFNTLVKTGSINCPSGTQFGGLFGNITQLICPTPAFVSALPTISPATATTGTTPLHAGTTLTAAFPLLQGARPTNMASSTTTTWQWQRCGLLGCINVPSVSGQPTKYLVSGADIGSRIQVTVTVSNSDGSVPGTGVGTGTASSTPTKVVS